MSRFLHNFVHNTKGIAALEYALIAGLMFALIVGAVTTMGTGLTNSFTNIGLTLGLHSAGT
jgi:pilus assembly protein Flp/PilA